jgi:DNA-binding NarL/FixJ family response regulator
VAGIRPATVSQLRAREVERLLTNIREREEANIMRKLHLRSVSDLVRYAIRNKIVQP